MSSAVTFTLNIVCGACGVAERATMTLGEPVAAPVLAKTVHTCSGCGIEIEYSLELKPRVLNRGLMAYATLEQPPATIGGEDG